jgi:hypothetical protein
MTDKQKTKLLEIFNVLDTEIGDTDPDFSGMSQAEIQEEEPIFWCAKEISKLLGKKWDRFANILSQSETPTPAELAQQFADLTGQKVWIWQSARESTRWFVSQKEPGLGLSSYKFYDVETMVINRPVSYTGRWQDSKVTATPKVKP